MKKLLIILSLVALAGFASAQTNPSYRYQSGYYKPSTGTYVRPHFKTNINGTNGDNYSTKGNINPWTGIRGGRARDYSAEADGYGSGKTIYTGPLGGQFYYNSNGNKTYVPKRYENNYSLPMGSSIDNSAKIERNSVLHNYSGGNTGYESTDELPALDFIEPSLSVDIDDYSIPFDDTTSEDLDDGSDD
jgi:hypothetical protein